VEIAREQSVEGALKHPVEVALEQSMESAVEQPDQILAAVC
jgi:hypothetical protein